MEIFVLQSLNYFTKMDDEEFISYKVCCWGKNQSSQESEETTKERDQHSNEHRKSYNHGRYIRKIKSHEHWLKLLVKSQIERRA